jgi:thioredoxin reductase
MNVDAIVVGGSYAGLSAAMQLARTRRQVPIVDAGKPRNRFARASHGFFGQDGRQPAAMLASAREQVLAYPTVQFISGEAVQAKDGDNGFTITLKDGTSHHGSRLVLATGVTDELPTLPGLAERWGVSVFHCPYCHGYEVATKRLGVLATIPKIHQAIMLPDWGPTTFFTNGVFEPEEEQLADLARRNVTIETTPVAAVLGDAPAISGLELADGRVVPIDAIFTTPYPARQPAGRAARLRIGGWAAGAVHRRGRLQGDERAGCLRRRRRGQRHAQRHLRLRLRRHGRHRGAPIAHLRPRGIVRSGRIESCVASRRPLTARASKRERA